MVERVLFPKRPGVRYYTGQERQQEEKGDQVHVVRLFGDDAETLERTAESLESLFTRLPGVLGLKSAEDPAPSELGLVIDRARAQQQGVNPQVVAGVVDYALRCQELSRYRTGDKDIPVRIRLGLGHSLPPPTANFRDYLPGFVARLKGVPDLNVILETKGYDPLERPQAPRERRRPALPQAPRKCLSVRVCRRPFDSLTAWLSRRDAWRVVGPPVPGSYPHPSYLGVPNAAGS